jgi:hypothetical protein
VAGSNIVLDPPTGEGVVTINATGGGGGGGVTSVTASGAGITATPTTGAVVVANTGVTSLVAGAGITLSGATGAVTVTNSSAVQLPRVDYQIVVATNPLTIESVSTDTVKVTLTPSTVEANSFRAVIAKGDWVASDIYMCSLIDVPNIGGTGGDIRGTLFAYYSPSAYVVVTYRADSSIVGATPPIATLMRYSGNNIPR